MDQEIQQSDKQKIVALVQSEHANTVISILKRIVQTNSQSLVGDNEFGTIVNAVRFDTQQNMILEVLKLYESVKDGSFISNQ